MKSGISHILCGVDGSAPACIAATRAAELAVALGADLTFVAVAREASPNVEIDAYRKTEGIEGERVPLLTKDAEVCLVVALGKAAERGHKSAKRIVRTGKVSSTLISVAADIGADATAIGRRRHSGIRRAVLGSVSQEIADQTSLTIISVCC